MIGKGSLSSIHQISKIIQVKTRMLTMNGCWNVFNPHIKVCGNTFCLKIMKTFIYSFSQVGKIIMIQNMKHIFLIQKKNLSCLNLKSWLHPIKENNEVTYFPQYKRSINVWLLQSIKKDHVFKSTSQKIRNIMFISNNEHLCLPEIYNSTPMKKYGDMFWIYLSL